MSLFHCFQERGQKPFQPGCDVRTASQASAEIARYNRRNSCGDYGVFLWEGQWLSGSLFHVPAWNACHQPIND